MKHNLQFFVCLLLTGSLLLPGCAPQAPDEPAADSGRLRVLVVETFLADITQNIAGERLQIETLIPIGMDPHAFVATPQDVAKISGSQVLVVNGAGFEEWLDEVLANAGGERLVIEAAAGLTSRSPAQGEETAPGDAESGGDQHIEGDPHFWLDPLSVVRYVENIRDGLGQADPAGQAIYAQNAAAYIIQLTELDNWIKTELEAIPPAQRLIVTNHESFGYFADRYGFQIVGTIIPSVSTGATPSAQQMAQLIDDIRASGVSAIFIETGANPELADQIAAETGVQVVTDLYSHSISEPGGKAPTYIDMMKYNVTTILEALK